MLARVPPSLRDLGLVGPILSFGPYGALLNSGEFSTLILNREKGTNDVIPDSSLPLRMTSGGIFS